MITHGPSAIGRQHFLQLNGGETFWRCGTELRGVPQWTSQLTVNDLLLPTTNDLFLKNQYIILFFIFLRSRNEETEAAGTRETRIGC